MTDLQAPRPPSPVEYDDPTEGDRVHAMETNMAAAGVATHEPVPSDYFGFDARERIMLPDGVSWVEHSLLNEGQRRKYLNKVNRDVKFQKATGDAIMRLAPGDEKMELLRLALSNWNLVKGGVSLPFNDRNLADFLEKADPRVIDLIEKEVKKANPWLLQEMSLEDMDREIASLQEMRQRKVEDDEGKALSNGR